MIARMSAAWRTPNRRALPIDLILYIAIALFALALRYPHFMTIPALTDESAEVIWGLQKFTFRSLPLVAVDSYDGPLFAGMVAVAFKVIGLNILVPRALVLILGALTVGSTYLLGKEFARGDRRAGLLAAFLLAVNAHHILFNSHVAWSNDTTPFFTTLALVAYWRGTHSGRPAWLGIAGFLYGCALQTHPSALALAPGLVLDFILTKRARPLIRTPWPYLGMAATLLAYSTVIYYNLTHSFESLQKASGAGYALITRPSLGETLVSIPPTLVAVARTALGSMGESTTVSLWTDPFIILFLVLTVTALAWLVKRGEYLAPLVLACAVLFLSATNRFRVMPDSARYFQDLNPILFMTWSLLGVTVWDRFAGYARWQHLTARSAVGLVVALLAVLSLSDLYVYYRTFEANGRNNAGMLQMVALTQGDRDVPVLVDSGLGGLRTGRGGVVSNDIYYLFLTSGQRVDIASWRQEDELRQVQSRLRNTPRSFLVSFIDARNSLGTDLPIRELFRTRFPCPSCTVPNDFVLYSWENPNGSVRQ